MAARPLRPRSRGAESRDAYGHRLPLERTVSPSAAWLGVGGYAPSHERSNTLRSAPKPSVVIGSPVLLADGLASSRRMVGTVGPSAGAKASPS